jgi:hypothetical protein
MFDLNASFLFASLIWGAIGTGFFIYGWKQKAMVPLAGGLLLSAFCYFISSALYLSLAGILILGGMYWMKGRFD